MPVTVMGEPNASVPQVIPAQVIGPWVYQQNTTANSADALRASSPSGVTYYSPFWNYTYAPFYVRGISGVVNNNAAANTATITLAASAAASAFNGTEAPATIASTNYVFAGGFTGRFFVTFPKPIGLPWTKTGGSASGGTTMTISLISTVAAALDLFAYLHLEP